MAIFRFRLQAVLDHKQRQEELKQLAYAQALAAQQREEQALAQLTATEMAARDQMRRQYLLGRLDVWNIQVALRHLDVLASQIVVQREAVQRAQEEAEAQRQELVAAMKERQVLETLKERLRARWRLEQDRIEARLVDELATMRHARKTQQVYRLLPPPATQTARPQALG